MLEARGLTKYYSAITGVRDVNFRIERGARRGQHGVHGQRMVAARMGAPQEPSTT